MVRFKLKTACISLWLPFSCASFADNAVGQCNPALSPFGDPHKPRRAKGALQAVCWLAQGEAWTDAQVLQRRLDALERAPAVVRSSVVGMHGRLRADGPAQFHTHDVRS